MNWTGLLIVKSFKAMCCYIQMALKQLLNVAVILRKISYKFTTNSSTVLGTHLQLVCK